MTHDDKLMLMAWSRGLAGAGARLAKRAWWVLQDSGRRPPAELVGAWANASEAQAWILNFHSMGLVGLMDAPRSGRPSVHADTVSHAREQLQALAADGKNARAQRVKLLETLSSEEKDSLRRTMRRRGETILRNRGGLDVPIPVPAGLRDLLCVHLGSGVKMLAFFPESSRHSDQLNGVWMGVANARLAADGNKAKKHDLIHALQTEIRVASRSADPAKASLKAEKAEAILEERVLGHLELVAESHPGSVVLHVLVDLDQGPRMVRVLRGLRARKLWPTGLGKSPGLLAGLRVVPYETSWAAAAQMTLAENLQHVDGALLGELQDQLTLKRKNVFSWVRTEDVDQTEPASAWLAQEAAE